MRSCSLLILSAILVAGLAPGALSVTPVDDFGNMYVDRILESLGANLKENNMDPLPLDDLVIGFSKKILLITVSGSISLTKGRLAGLSSMHRSGDCQIQTEGTSKLVVDANIGVNNIHGAFNGRAEFMGIGLNAQLSLTVAKVTVDARIIANLGTGASPDLDRFSISSLSTVTVKFSGLGPLDWIINPVTNVLVSILQGVLVKIIEIPVRAQVKKVLQTIQLPFQLRMAYYHAN